MKNIQYYTIESNWPDLLECCILKKSTDLEVLFYTNNPYNNCSCLRMILFNESLANIKSLKERYKKVKNTSNIEVITAEKNDDYSDDSLFNISSWGADLSFREICQMYDENELVKPELQRKYVWDKMEASRFVESILMGLPVPSLFFAQSGSRKLIVDGYQRIMTIHDYTRGIFSADNKVFKLSNSDRINSRWRNKAFSELSDDDKRKIKSTTIHVIIFEQKHPENDDTSLYQIFERINTSGKTLTPQEIRNCVYQGSFNTLLFSLNENPKWRKLFGAVHPDGRMRDIECILRFFLMKSDMVQKSDLHQISLKKELNQFMGEYRDADINIIEHFRDEFLNTISLIYDCFGVNAFRNYTNGKFSKKFHPAIFDAISVGVFQCIECGETITPISFNNHISLFKNDDFNDSIKYRTTDLDNIKKRISIIRQSLGEWNHEG